MNKKVALLVLLFAVTAMVCRSHHNEKDESWTDWAKDKIAGAFGHDHDHDKTTSQDAADTGRDANNHQLKSTAQDATNTAKDAASGSADYVSEKAMEAEDAAADAAKELSDKGN